ncbi:dihydrofolate reductase family protein [Pseudonocardia sichuanensis]|uniref:Dihydrofolate reductase n=1 Tax=Pseudonocardia kunmingensis TaxID=630975 RepID=A0A543DWB5_9PSEU|nr:dihydrofolate reductase family protein [Pseudonocardia kunmingensis]TQM13569.1 dihydrofolate reductase [Pseudonocardia kunmingensis]
MAKVLYSVTMSLDGFIAGPGGDMSWLTPFLGPDPLVTELISRTGAILVGGRTFRGDSPHRGTEAEGQVFGGGWSGPQFVLTSRPPREPLPGFTFVTDLQEAVTAARAAAGDGYVDVLGARTARSCLEAGVLDEVLTCIAPVLLGDGVRLFDHPGGTTVALERMDVSHTPLSTNIWYRVAR